MVQSINKYKYICKTYRYDYGKQVSLGPLIVQGSVDRDLTLVREIDGKVSVAIGTCDPGTAHPLVRPIICSVAFDYEILDLTIDSCIGISRCNSRKYRRTNWC